MGKTRAYDLSPGNGTDYMCTVQDWRLKGRIDDAIQMSTPPLAPKLPVHTSTMLDGAPQQYPVACLLPRHSPWVTPNLPLQAPAPSILPGSIIKLSIDLACIIQSPVGKNYSDPIPSVRKPRGLGSLTIPQMDRDLEENSSSPNHAAYRYYTQVLTHPPHTHPS